MLVLFYHLFMLGSNHLVSYWSCPNGIGLELRLPACAQFYIVYHVRDVCLLVEYNKWHWWHWWQIGNHSTVGCHLPWFRFGKINSFRIENVELE